MRAQPLWLPMMVTWLRASSPVTARPESVPITGACGVGSARTGTISPRWISA